MGWFWILTACVASALVGAGVMRAMDWLRDLSRDDEDAPVIGDTGGWERG